MSGVPMFSYLNKDAFVISTSVFSAVATLANLFLMIVILMSPTLRTSSKYIIIFVLCLTDLYSGVVVFPLIAQFYSLEEWTHDVNLFRALDYTAYYAMLLIRMGLVISIGANCILKMLSRNKRVLILLSVTMVLGAIGYGLVLALPTFERGHLQDGCYFERLQAKQDTVSFTFFSQVAVMIVTAVNICVIHFCFSRSLPEVTEEEPRRFPLDVVLASVMMIVHLVPFRIVHLYFESCSDSETCRQMYLSRGITGQWEYVRPCLMPFIWLLCQTTRKAIKQVCCCGSDDIPVQPQINSDYTRYHDIPKKALDCRL